MQIPRIYKGDDTDFRGNQNLAIRLNTDLNLAGCTVEFTFLGHKRTFNAPQDGQNLPFVFTSAETATMPLGTHKAKLRIFDTAGRVRTVDDSIRIMVTDSIKLAYGDGEQEITVNMDTTPHALTADDEFDCDTDINGLVERISYLWEKSGGTVKNRESLETID